MRRDLPELGEILRPGYVHRELAVLACDIGARIPGLGLLEEGLVKTRGCQDILIAVVDGLKGLADAITTVYPQATVQTCIEHLIRNSLDYAGWKDRKQVAHALRPIYTAVSEQVAQEQLHAFADGPWGVQYPMIVQSWTRTWEHVTPFFVFPPDIRRVLYTTNAIESPNMQLRKVIKTRGHFPTDEAANKLLWLALRNVLTKSVPSAFDWKRTMNQFAILYGDRFTLARNWRDRRSD